MVYSLLPHTSPHSWTVNLYLSRYGISLYYLYISSLSLFTHLEKGIFVYFLGLTASLFGAMICKVALRSRKKDIFVGVGFHVFSSPGRAFTN